MLMSCKGIVIVKQIT